MDYLRETVDSAKISSIFNLPSALQNTKVEVIILPAVSETATTQQPKRGSAFGCLKKYANPALIHLEEGAWERAAVAKYADN